MNNILHFPDMMMMMTIQKADSRSEYKVIITPARHCDSLSANIRNLLLLSGAAVTMTDDNVELSARM